MALNVKIDFDECYEFEDISDNLSAYSFTTVLKDGSNAILSVQINGQRHHLMPDVYNLAFGPLNENGEIDDTVKLKHRDHSKVFSTIVFAAMTFLAKNVSKFLGIDGSNNARAYMYYRCIRNNFEYLSQFFKIYGVKYYVRILRKIKDEDPGAPVDAQDVIAMPILIEHSGYISSDKLYNYFIFTLKKPNS